MIEAIPELGRFASLQLPLYPEAEPIEPILRKRRSGHSDLKISINLKDLANFVKKSEVAINVQMIDTTGKTQTVEVEDDFCKKKLQCGHRCKGYKNEKKCPPCINEDCARK